MRKDGVGFIWFLPEPKTVGLETPQYPGRNRGVSSFGADMGMRFSDGATDRMELYRRAAIAPWAVQIHPAYRAYVRRIVLAMNQPGPFRTHKPKRLVWPEVR